MRQRLCLFMKICEPLFSARRVQRRAQRGGRGHTGETKKSRLAVRRVRVNFLVSPVNLLKHLRLSHQPTPTKQQPYKVAPIG